ncbi:hypothetical protein [Proteiniborus ethanoligenes]|nr:hypothetical protein [Proteiniborus ethanoligenes]
MKIRYKDFKIENINENNTNQKNRYRENYYHPYDDINNIQLKQKTNDIR